ncbi:putative membrane protein [Campylobacter sp. CCUG 57310]|nr:putative membrane protein [Campylobacter sp. CCUG 57310]
MSVTLGILSVIFIALARKNKKFFFAIGLCFVFFIGLLLANDNKFLDFFYFFFATGITQIVLTVLLNLKISNLNNYNFIKESS